MAKREGHDHKAAQDTYSTAIKLRGVTTEIIARGALGLSAAAFALSRTAWIRSESVRLNTPEPPGRLPAGLLSQGGLPDRLQPGDRRRPGLDAGPGGGPRGLALRAGARLLGEVTAEPAPPAKTAVSSAQSTKSMLSDKNLKQKGFTKLVNEGGEGGAVSADLGDVAGRTDSGDLLGEDDLHLGLLSASWTCTAAVPSRGRS